MGFDGISVEQYIEAEAAERIDIESMAMEFSFRFIELKNAAASLEMGEIRDITIKADQGCLLVNCITDEFFVAVLLEETGHFGKGRWVLRSRGSQLVSEL